MKNVDHKTINSFGDEWLRFDQSKLDSEESDNIFNDYFNIFPWHLIDLNSVGFDMGCGSGRWARKIASKVKILNCVDPSDAIYIAKNNLKEFDNIIYFKLSVDDNIFEKNSQDFGYSLGVLHHLPNTKEALISCNNYLKPGAPFLVYLYYSLDNRNIFYKYLWNISNYMRLLICKLPSTSKNYVTDLLAFLIYLPLTFFYRFLKLININTNNFPLSYYTNKSFYTMRTDSRDRFGTPLEKRFSKTEITKMLENANFENLIFCNNNPFWCVLAYKRAD